MLRRRLLWIDCSAGLVAGVVVLGLKPWLAVWTGLPGGLLLVIGVANLAYGCFSLSLAVRPVRPMGLIQLLVFANLAWAVLCLFWAARFHAEVRVLGLVQLVGEAVLVGGLGGVEWRYRHWLVNARDA